MTEYISGIPVSCPKCNSSGVEHVTRYVWWVNQHGAKIRVFCHVCGQATDKTLRKGVLDNHFLEMRVAIWKQGEYLGDLPF